MKTKHPQQGTRDLDALVAEAEAQVLRCGRRLSVLIDRLEAGELVASGEVPGAISALDKALGAVFSERARRDRAGAGPGPVPEGELDLGAARAEVRRRLDRLRADLDAGGVP
jgi:hypothetical protein